jgi:hypothetical protein
MQCLACGAEMQLREVVLTDIPTLPGFERHTYRCSACQQVASRLVICRAKMPMVDPLFNQPRAKRRPIKFILMA